MVVLNRKWISIMSWYVPLQLNKPKWHIYIIPYDIVPALLQWFILINLTELISGSQSQERGEIFDFSLRLSFPKLHDNLQLFSVTNNNNFSQWMFCENRHTRFVTLALFWWSLMISSIWSRNSSQRKISDKREKRNPRS